MRKLLLLALLSMSCLRPALGDDSRPELLIRVDDIGMNHSVNLALEELVRTGIPFSASVMVPCPWFTEAAKILARTPQASVGVHLTLNSEWADYRWGPVLGSRTVPSLVGDDGYFHATGAALRDGGMHLDEFEAELRAQITRAQQAGLDIDYLDYHMLTAVSTPELVAIVERLAAEFGLGLSRYFNETSISLWDIEPADKFGALMASLDAVKPGRTTLLVMHLGLETPEMRALVDANNPRDPYRVALHRAAELDALTSKAFLDAVAQRQIRLTTYRDLVSRQGLDAMRQPAGFGYVDAADSD